MRVEFNQGVPEGCVEWLYENVGRGNITNIEDSGDYAWFYRRERVYPQGHGVLRTDQFYLGPKYVPTITVKDPKLGTLFALRWS